MSTELAWPRRPSLRCCTTITPIPAGGSPSNVARVGARAPVLRDLRRRFRTSPAQTSSFSRPVLHALLSAWPGGLFLSVQLQPVERFDDRLAEVLVDERRPQVVDLGSAAEPVEHKGVQWFGVGHGNVQQVVVVPGDIEEAERLGEGEQVSDEGVHQVARVGAEADGDQGLELASQAGKIDLGPEATDDPAGTQAPNALQAGRGGGACQGCEVLVG